MADPQEEAAFRLAAELAREQKEREQALERQAKEAEAAGNMTKMMEAEMKQDRARNNRRDDGGRGK